VVDSSRPDEGSLPDAALKAIVAGGMAGVLNEAGKLPAAERYSKTMMEMFEQDSRYLEWTLEQWEVHLGGSKKTIQGCDAWKYRMARREGNKRERLSE